MSQTVINVGTVANDGTGDPLRTAFIAVNANFAEIYGLMPRDSSNNLTAAAPINSPQFTGDPKGVTQPAGNNTTSLATTAFVTQADNVLKGDYDAKLALKANIAAPQLTGDAQTMQVIVDSSSGKTIANTEWVKRNFAIVKPDAPPPAGVDLALYAPLASPHLTGIPLAPTALNTVNTDQIATTAYVQNVILGLAPGPGPGGGDPIPPTLGKFLGTAPAGRLSLQSKQPVMFGDITGATTIYYTPYNGITIPIYDGTDMVITRFDEGSNGEISAVVSDASHSPPAGIMTGKVYDWFVWHDKSVPATPVVRLSRGPAWTDVSNRDSPMVGSSGSRASGSIRRISRMDPQPSAGRLSVRLTAGPMVSLRGSGAASTSRDVSISGTPLIGSMSARLFSMIPSLGRYIPRTPSRMASTTGR